MVGGPTSVECTANPPSGFLSMWNSSLAFLVCNGILNPGNACDKPENTVSRILCCTSSRVAPSIDGTVGSVARAMNPPSGLGSMLYAYFLVIVWMSIARDFSALLGRSLITSVLLGNRQKAFAGLT